jgi:hypothetical protein
MLIMNGFQVSSDCTHPEAAWRWVKHLISREWMLEFMIRTGRTPSEDGGRIWRAPSTLRWSFSVAGYQWKWHG